MRVYNWVGIVSSPELAFGFIWGDKILIDVILIKLFPECYRYQLASTEREKEGAGREKKRRKERGRVGGREEGGEKKERGRRREERKERCFPLAPCCAQDEPTNHDKGTHFRFPVLLWPSQTWHPPSCVHRLDRAASTAFWAHHKFWWTWPVESSVSPNLRGPFCPNRERAHRPTRNWIQGKGHSSPPPAPCQPCTTDSPQAHPRTPVLAAGSPGHLCSELVRRWHWVSPVLRQYYVLRPKACIQGGQQTHHGWALCAVNGGVTGPLTCCSNPLGTKRLPCFFFFFLGLILHLAAQTAGLS